MTPKREINLKDPNENLYRFAEGHFLRMIHDRSIQIKSMTIVQNPVLQTAFYQKQATFKANKISSKAIFAYHGTSSQVTDSILKNNFDLAFAQRQAHGRGNYFSEYPDVSLGYGPGLIFCHILPGKEYVGNNHDWPGY